MNRNITFRLKTFLQVSVFLSLFFAAFTQNLSAQTPYCAPLYNYPCSASDGFGVYIKAFNLKKNGANILSDTAACTTLPSGLLALNYAQFTTTTPSVASGVRYDFDLAFMKSGDIPTDAGYAVWMDLNNDNDFDDAGELLRTGLTSGIGYFTIPLATSAGNHRLRVRCRKDFASNTFSAVIPTDPCATYQIGSTRDYTLKVTNCTGFTMTTDSVDLTCNGLTDGSIRITTSGGTGAKKFSKDNGVTFVAGTSPYTFSGLTAGSYPIIAKDSNGCEAGVKYVLVNQPDPLSINIVSFQSPTDCQSYDGFVNLAGTGGTLPYRFSAIGFPWSSKTNYNYLSTGTHNFYIQDSKGCQNSIAQDLLLPSIPTLSLISKTNILCNGAALGSITVKIEGGKQPYQLSKFAREYFELVASQHTYAFLPARKYEIIALDSNGCFSKTLIVNLTQPPPIVFTMNKTNTACSVPNGSVAVSASGGSGNLNITCSNCPAPASQGVYSNLPAGTYSFSALDANNCRADTSITIENIDFVPPTPTVASSQIACKNMPFTLTPTGGTMYKFYDNNPTYGNVIPLSTGTSFTFLAQTTRIIWITSVNGTCTSSPISTFITVDDNVKPDARCKSITIQLDALGKATLSAAQIDDGTTDNCQVKSITVDKTVFNCNNIGPNTVLFTAKDSTGNTATCTATVTVEDRIYPTLVCKSVSIPLDATGIATLTTTMVDSIVTDNCGITQRTLAKTVFNCADLGTNTVVYSVSDDSRNVTTCSVSVTVVDRIKPAANCKPATIQLDGSGTAILNYVQIDNASTDNCSAMQGSLSKATFNCSNLGTNTVIYTASDASGNTSTCSTTVKVEDKIAPSVFCKPLTVQLDASGNAALNIALIDNNSTDNCGITQRTLSKPILNCSNLGTNSVIFTATDASGNSATCSATVIVEDRIFPTVTCKPTTIQLNASGIAVLDPIAVDNNAADNCGITQRSVSKSTFDCTNLGSNSVTLTVRDASGNVAICFSTVTVIDNIKPVLQCKPVTIQLDATGNTALTIAQIDNNSTDNCGITQKSISKTSFNCSNLGTNTVIFTANDVSGNTSTCSAVVTVEDKIAPSVFCKPTTIQLDAVGNGALTFTQIEQSATDNCGITQKALSKSTFNCSNIGSNTVIYTATDASGNASTCSAFVTVEDKSNPFVVCKAATIVLDATGNVTLTPIQIESSATDNCGISEKTISKSTFNCTNLGANTVIYTVKDAFGNTSTCSAIVTVEDRTKPIISCKPATIQLDATGNVALVVAQIDNGSSDNCGISQRTLSKTTFNCSNLGINSVVFTAKDISGNTSTCSATVIVEDKIAPSVFCKPATIALDISGIAALPITQIDNNSTDNCGITQRTLSKAAFNCSNIGVNSVIFTATDASGNSATCSATVTVEDKVNPTAFCKPATIQLDATGNANLTLSQIDNGSTDNCGLTQRSLSKTAFNCSNLGSNTVIFTATDALGNSSTCSTTVTVEDKIAPSVSCKPATIEYNAFGKASLTIADIDNNSTDNCGITQRALSKTQFDCTNLGSNTVVFTATDVSGNTATCVTTVTVIYQSNPSVLCKNVTIQLNASGIATLSVPQIDNNSTDNCGITQRTLSKSTFDCSNIGTNTVVFTATYANGQTPSCSATVIVEDKISPVALCKPATIQLNAAGTATLTPVLVDNNSTDNCAVTKRTLSKITYDCTNLGTSTVIFTATDASGNTSTCSTTVKVEDKINPIALCKPATIQLDATGNATLNVDLLDNNSTDNCGITERLLSKTIFNCGNLGTNSIILTLKDASGNISTCSANVTVEDKITPSVNCKPATIQLDASGNASLTAALIDANSTDNCGITQRTISKTTFNCANLGTNTVVFTSTDATGNTSTCQATVTVTDKIAPSVFCKPATIQLDEAGSATINVAQIDNNSSDNCGIINRTLSKTAFDCTQLGTNQVIFTATDVSGNTSTCSATVIVEDKIKPTVLCKPTTIQFGASGFAVLTANLIDNNSTDNCGITQRTLSKTSFDCSNAGTNTVIYTATDASGNSATCSASVKVEYQPNPAVSCKTVTLKLDATGNATLSAVQVDEYASNNCVIASRSVSKTSFNCSNLGSNTVLLTVTDVFGHASSCSATVIVEDKTAPTVKCPSNMTVQLGSGECRRVLNFGATATDNCTTAPIVTQLTGLQSGEEFGIGTFNTGFKAVDAVGNTSQCTFSITVKEFDETGGMVCRNQIEVAVSANCATKVQTDWILLGNNYGCFEKYTLQLMTPGGTIIPAATATSAHIGLTLNALITSPSGNSCTSSTIRIVDLIAPTIQAPAPAVVVCDQLNANGIPLSSLTGEPSVIQECSLPVTNSYNDQNIDINCSSVLTAPPAGFPTDLTFDVVKAQNTKRIIIRTFKVSDRSNNTATTRQVIYIKNKSVGDVTMPASRNLTCGNLRTEPTDTIINGVTIQGTGVPTLSNNQPLTGTFCTIGTSYNDVRTQNAANNTITILRTWLVVNTCNNEIRNYVQTILLRDAAPTLSLLQDKTFQIPVNQQLIVNAQDLINILNDDCTPNNKMMFGLRVVGTGTGFPTGSTLIFDCNEKGTYNVEVWVKDEGGNVTYSTTTIIVSDEGSKCPTLSGMISREDLMPVPANILLYNATNDSINSTTGSSYFFKNLLVNSRFRVMPIRPNTDWINGVTMFDVALMSRHILGAEPITSPYRLIAADVNHTGEVDAVDMLLMRRLILRINNEFQNNNSWRFVLKNYVFDDPTNPFASDFPESLLVPVLTQTIQNGDFVAIKVGDVNLSAGSVAIRGGAKPFVLSIEDKILEKDKTYQIPIKLSPYQRDFIGNNLSALQFSLDIDKKAAHIEGITKGDLPNCSENDVAIFKNEGVVTAGWYSTPNQKYIENDSFTIFQLTIKATANTRLSQILSLNPSFTEGVAFDEIGNGAPLKLSFGNKYKSVEKPILLPNRPNPFRDETTISFVLPEAGFAKISVCDLMGRVLMIQEKAFVKGLNEVVFDTKTHPSVSSGILVVRLQTENGLAEQKIVLSR